MNLTKLNLNQFKNYFEAHLSFQQSVNCFVGNNGEGKTNLLDAIYYLCIGKSYFNNIEKQNILHQKDFFRLEGDFDGDFIEISYSAQTKKRILKNKIEYERLANHLGFAPVTFIAPDDNMIILGGSELRRRFFNTTISQVNSGYVKDLLQYRKLLNQRNAVLKSGYVQKQLIETYNQQLVPLGKIIHAVRKKYIQQLSKLVANVYNAISEEKEKVSCTYSSQLNKANFEDLIAESYEKDRLLKRTTVGIHKDDLKLKIDGFNVKKFGSQGQQKTVLLALKLAEYKMIEELTGKRPILLLDDIFDKLDRGRVRQLFRYLINEQSGQIFMTDTNAERLQETLNEFGIEFAIFKLENNQFTKDEFR